MMTSRQVSYESHNDIQLICWWGSYVILKKSQDDISIISRWLGYETHKGVRQNYWWDSSSLGKAL